MLRKAKTSKGTYDFSANKFTLSSDADNYFTLATHRSLENGKIYY